VIKSLHIELKQNSEDSRLYDLIKSLSSFHIADDTQLCCCSSSWYLRYNLTRFGVKSYC